MPLNLHSFVNIVMRFWLLDSFLSEQIVTFFSYVDIIEVSLSVSMALNTDRMDGQAKKKKNQYNLRVLNGLFVNFS